MHKNHIQMALYLLCILTSSVLIASKPSKLFAALKAKIQAKQAKLSEQQKSHAHHEDQEPSVSYSQSMVIAPGGPQKDPRVQQSSTAADKQIVHYITPGAAAADKKKGEGKQSAECQVMVAKKEYRIESPLDNYVVTISLRQQLADKDWEPICKIMFQAKQLFTASKTFETMLKESKENQEALQTYKHHFYSQTIYLDVANDPNYQKKSDTQWQALTKKYGEAFVIRASIIDQEKSGFIACCEKTRAFLEYCEQTVDPGIIRDIKKTLKGFNVMNLEQLLHALDPLGRKDETKGIKNKFLAAWNSIK